MQVRYGLQHIAEDAHDSHRVEALLAVLEHHVHDAAAWIAARQFVRRAARALVNIRAHYEAVRRHGGGGCRRVPEQYSIRMYASGMPSLLVTKAWSM